MTRAPKADAPAGLKRRPPGYAEWLTDLKARIHAAQQRAALAVNRELLQLYWQLGRDILERQAQEGWGAGIIDQVSLDLKAAFPDVKGFSRSNLKYMRAFAEAWPDLPIGQQPVGQLPWGHNLVLLTKLKLPEQRLLYAQRALEHGWSRNVLVLHIEQRTLEREGKALTNFAQQLPKAQSDLAQESLKDPYRFRGEDFFIDLLFYHLKLRAYVVIELKAGDFKPEHTGKLGFYLSAVDAQVKAKEDGATIGLLLCKNKNRVVAEYALRDTNKPIGVAEYQLVEALPKELEESLPSIEQIEREMGGEG